MIKSQVWGLIHFPPSHLHSAVSTEYLCRPGTWTLGPECLSPSPRPAAVARAAGCTQMALAPTTAACASLASSCQPCYPARGLAPSGSIVRSHREAASATAPVKRWLLGIVGTEIPAAWLLGALWGTPFPPAPSAQEGPSSARCSSLALSLSRSFLYSPWGASRTHLSRK